MKNKIPKKKISLKEWTYIGKYNPAAKWCRPFCSYTLIRRGEKTFIREQKINLLVYIIIFIPIHILQAFACMWEGGLAEFTILKRDISKDFLTIGQGSYARALRIWNGEKVDLSKD